MTTVFKRVPAIGKCFSIYDIKISSEIGMRLPLLAGAGGKALLCQLSDEQIDHIVSENALKQFTCKTCTDRNEFKKDCSWNQSSFFTDRNI